MLRCWRRRKGDLFCYRNFMFHRSRCFLGLGCRTSNSLQGALNLGGEGRKKSRRNKAWQLEAPHSISYSAFYHLPVSGMNDEEDTISVHINAKWSQSLGSVFILRQNQFNVIIARVHKLTLSQVLFCCAQLNVFNLSTVEIG